VLGAACWVAAKDGATAIAAATKAAGHRHPFREQGFPIATRVILDFTGLDPPPAAGRHMFG
jgi:hypothetical protein